MNEKRSGSEFSESDSLREWEERAVARQAIVADFQEQWLDEIGSAYTAEVGRRLEGRDITDATKKAIEKRARKAAQVTFAKAKIESLWDDWKPEYGDPVDFMYFIVETTQIPLATVNLAYSQVAKERRRQTR